MRVNLLVCAAVLIILFSDAASGWAETGTDLLTGDWENLQALNVDSSLSLQPSSHEKDSGQGVRLSILHSDLRWRPWPAWEGTPTAGYSLTLLHVQSHDARLPPVLTDLSVGLAGPLFKVGDWALIAGAGVGFAGNPSFDHGQAYYGLGTLLFARQFGNNSSLMVGVDYDGHRSLFPDLPLPVFAYSGEFGTNVSYVVGFPCSSVTWRISKLLTAELDVQAPAVIESHLRYQFLQSSTLEASFTNFDQPFQVNGDTVNHRLFFEQQLLELAAHWRPTAPVEMLVGAGYAFDQRFSRGFDDRDSAVVERLHDGPQFRFGVLIRF